MWHRVVTLCVAPADLYCTLEVDSFGYFVNKAKTRVYRDTAEPNWNEVRRPFPPFLAAALVLGGVRTPRGSPRLPPKAAHSGNLLGEG